MKIKTYSQLQAARARVITIAKAGGADITKPPSEDNACWLDADQQAEMSNLKLAIKSASAIETQLKATHKALKTKENPIMTAKTKLDNFLRQKSVVIDSADGSNLAISSLISGSIVARTRQSNGLLSQMTIAPLASVKSYILRDLTDAQIARYAESDGTIGFTNTDTVSGSIMKNYFTLSKLFHKLPITDEVMHDVPDLVAFTLDQLQTQYDEQFGSELVLGESASEELSGVLTDLLDADNAYVEALKADGVRDANTLGAMASSVVDSLGTKPLEVFNALVATLPAKLRADAIVTMHPDTLKAYQDVVDSNGQPLFKITPTSFEGYALSLDDNFPVLGDASKAVVSFGVADTALAMGNVDLKLQENPFQRDGVVLFKHIGRVGLAVKDNLALRVLLAQA
jgi:HK97 family phage major capsid protein